MTLFFVKIFKNSPNMEKIYVFIEGYTHVIFDTAILTTISLSLLKRLTTKSVPLIFAAFYNAQKIFIMKRNLIIFNKLIYCISQLLQISVILRIIIKIPV